MIPATAVGLFSGVGIIGALGIGALGLRFNMWPLAICCMALNTIGMVILLIAKTLPMVFLYNIVLGIGFGSFMTGLLTLFSSYYGRTDFPKIMGVTMPFGMLLGSSGAVISGALYDATGNYNLAFIIAAIFMLLCVVFIALAPPPRHPSLKD